MCEQSTLEETRPAMAGNAVGMRLYGAYSIIDDFLALHDRIKVHWFVEKRDGPIAPHELMIKDYEPEKCCYGDAFVDECFTQAEIEQLREYLERVHSEKLHVREVVLPISKHAMGYGAVGPSGWSIVNVKGEIIESKWIEDYYMMSKEPEFNLPFKVWGYFDTEEPADDVD